MFATLLVVGFLVLASATPDAARSTTDDRFDHVRKNYAKLRTTTANPEEAKAEFWNKMAQDALNAKLKQELNTNIAKNVILFMGDGMSFPTIKAARVHLAHLMEKPEEEPPLAFEKFPYAGLSKTYCADAQVADSACSATAYLCGVKTNDGTIGVTANVTYGDCEQGKDETNVVTSIGRWSQLKGKRTGVVTTTRVTHASPAGIYAHTADRDWESSSDVKEDCEDIAHQLVYGDTGKNLNVILGGGRSNFLPSSATDDEGYPGWRDDGANLIEEWLETKSGRAAEYVWNRTSLLAVPDTTEYLMGLFDVDHCQYHLDADPETEPTLEEMTEKAIRILSKGEKGFFLFVEGGRIDHGHHDDRALKAIDETLEFSKAVQKAADMTSGDDTLIVVTADHAHVMSYNGYPVRGSNIFAIAGTGKDSVPYTTISYSNGKGYRKDGVNGRYDVSKDDRENKNYEFPAMVPMKSETHGGEDVAIYARGPWAHLFTGAMEQNVIPHALAYASCVGDGAVACQTGAATSLQGLWWTRVLSYLAPILVVSIAKFATVL